ncbi:hypothetical protein ACIQ9P_22035 [Kitasatospora sp. NPDC094019]
MFDPCAEPAATGDSDSAGQNSEQSDDTAAHGRGTGGRFESY